MPATSRIFARLAGKATVGVLAGSVAATTMALALPAAQAGPDAAAPARTSQQSVVARPKTPKLHWYKCYRIAQCASVKVPLDYDQPGGATTELAVLRVKARDPRHRIGSLFVNPGGPGGSGTEMAYSARQFLSRSLLNRFDIVGFDPRGTNFSDNVTCFANQAAQGRVLNPLVNMAFPYTHKQVRRYVAASTAFGKACSSAGTPLAASMSTAQVARDMDLLRRAVGDSKLTYLGFSYGSYLGQVYANMFPNRVRALAIDGVINPRAWAGRKATAHQPQTDRLRSADASWRALHAILVRCDNAGGQRCAFAVGDPVRNFARIVARLKAKPLVYDDPFEGFRVRFDYPALISYVLSDLYSPYGAEDLAYMLSDLMVLTEPPAHRQTVSQLTQRQKVLRSFAKRLNAQKQTAKDRHPFGFPYDNSLEAFQSVLCTDGLNPAHARDWKAAAHKAGERARYFGRIWAWSSAPCASASWTAKDEDAYRGSFTHRTVNPVLVVGNTWDPATNYYSAVKAAKLLPNSRLLSSNSWGHTAYGTSTCVTSAINQYLLAKKLPAKGTRCQGDYQPFRGQMAFVRGLMRADAVAGTGSPAPVTDPLVPRY